MKDKNNIKTEKQRDRPIDKKNDFRKDKSFVIMSFFSRKHD